MSRENFESLRAQSLKDTIDQTEIKPDIRNLWERHNKFLSRSGIYDRWRPSKLYIDRNSHILKEPESFSTHAGNKFAQDVIKTAGSSDYHGAEDLIRGIGAIRKKVLNYARERSEHSLGVPWYYSLDMLFDDQHSIVVDAHHLNERDFDSWYRDKNDVRKIRKTLTSRFKGHFREKQYSSAEVLSSYDKEREIEKMAEIACEPTSDEHQLTQRQAVLDELIHSGKLDELLIHKETARLSADEAESRLRQRAFRYAHDNGTPILAYYKAGEDTVVSFTGHEYLDDEYEDEEDRKGIKINIVEELTIGCDSITTSCAALTRCAEFFQTFSNPLFRTEADVLEQLVEKAQELMSKDAILHRPREEEIKKEKEIIIFAEDTSEDMLWYFFSNNLTPALRRVGALLELSRFIRDGQFSRVGHDRTQQDYYKNGWNIAKNSEAQVKNGSLGEAPIAILSGANTSGKSFYLESDLTIRLIAQSIGYAPVEAGNVHMHNGYVFIGRAGTQTDQNLSSYTQEVTDLKEIVEGIKHGTRVYIDEGLSTASPDEQGQMLPAVGLDIVDNGGSCVLATHNRRAIDYLGSHDAGVYHLAVSVDPKENTLIRHFVLTEGVDDSYAVVAARTAGLQEDIIEGAVTYLEGYASLNAPKTIEHPIPVAFNPKEREVLKKQTQSIEHLFPDDPNSARFMLFSEDEDFTTGTFLRFLSNSDVLNEITDDAKKNNYREMLAKMVLFSPSLSPQETLERQKMFDELSTDNLYQEVATLVNQLNTCEVQMRMIAKASVKSGINKALNPFHVDPDNREVRKPDNKFVIEEKQLDRAVAFLQVNSILLGDKFPYGELLSKLTQAQTKFDTANADNPISDEVLHEVTALVGQLETINDKLPHIELSEVDVDPIRPQLEVLRKQFESEKDDNDISKTTRKKGSPFGDMFDIYYGGIPRALLDREKHIENIESLISKLNGTDSVYLNQTAFYVVELFAKLMQGSVPEKKADSDSNVLSRQSLSFLGGRRDRRDEFFGLFGFDHNDGGPLADELDKITALSLFADILATQNFARCEFTADDKIDLQNVLPIFVDNKKKVKSNSLSMGGNMRTELLTGPHSSGKTIYEKSAVAALLFALSTGYTTASSAALPLFDSVVYLDRVVEKHDSDKSSFATEIDYWKELIETVNSGSSAFVAIDDAGTTTTPKEGGAFFFSIVKKLFESGCLTITSNHNHDVIDMLVSISDGSIPPYHFSSVGEDGDILLDHVKKPGHEKSHAIAIARKQGFPERILKRAEDLATRN